MTRYDAAIGHSPRTSRRSRLALAGTAVAVVLALTACGTDKANANGEDAPTGTARTQNQAQNQPAAAPAAAAQEETPDDDAGDSQVSLAFLEMIVQVAEPCYPDPVPPVSEEVLPPGEEPPADLGAPPVDDAEPRPERVEGIEPPSELSAEETCAGKRHGERISKALAGKSTAPDQVRKVLNGLNYDNPAIHGLKRTGSTTHFAIDLRFMGSSLALKATTTAKGTVVEPVWAKEVGPFILPK
ncbi:hypothetical protein [Streptomyces sp. NPDC058953]|uniref:hypothetical protein n=1 Tax=unclassified Streptomyces TaxID=2593676 RepID=UPI003693CA74